MKTAIKVEEAAQFAVAVIALNLLPFQFAWYAWVGLFLLPDLSMGGYLAGSKVGAVCYNLVHHKATGIALFAAGLLANQPVLQLAGLLLFAHSAFDRTLSYGLKLPDSFNHTHLGWVGKSVRNNTALPA